MFMRGPLSSMEGLDAATHRQAGMVPNRSQRDLA
jgi:hypothetical protein